MDWNAIGAIGEIAGAIAVVVSLIYLASQIRHGNKLMTLEATKYISGQITPIIDMVLQNDELIDLMQKGHEELTERETAKLHLLGRRMIEAARQTYLAKDEVRDIEASILILRTVYHREKNNYGMPYVWPESKKAQTPDFAEWFEANIAS